MKDKPEMSAEERAKLKAELLAELKAELKQDAGQSEPEKPDETSTPTTKASPSKVESEPVKWDRSMTLAVLKILWILVPGAWFAFTIHPIGVLWCFGWMTFFQPKW